MMVFEEIMQSLEEIIEEVNSIPESTTLEESLRNIHTLDKLRREQEELHALAESYLEKRHSAYS